MPYKDKQKERECKKRWEAENRELVRISKAKYDAKKRVERLLNPPSPKNGICPMCGNGFVCKLQNPYQIYCSKKCRKQQEYIDNKVDYLRRGREKSIFRKMAEHEKIRVCTCGKQFRIRITRPGQIYCCVKCQAKYSSRKARQERPQQIQANANKYAKKSRELLFDTYVKNQILKDKPRIPVPNELIELKRTHIKLKRKIYGKQGSLSACAQ